MHLRSFQVVATLWMLAAAIACGGGAGSGAPEDSSTSTARDAGTAPSPPPTPPPPPPPPPPPADTPALTGPSDGAVVAGFAVALAASAPDGTARVEFQVDGATIATASSAPFTANWDSFTASNGVHALAVRAIDAAGTAKASPPITVTVSNHIRNVFVMVFENHDWSSIKGNPSAPYINRTLLAQGAHADNYQNVPGLHPSLPNYIWMEAGSNLGVTDDSQPSQRLLTTSQHLVAQLKAAGISWKAYQEDIPGTDCPLTYVNRYGPKHLPMIYFADVNGGLDRNSAECIARIRPYGELARDLETGAVPSYSFITPNLCNDMHDCSIATGDAWLSREVPKILASRAYQDGGALFITFDESAGSNVPIGFIALSPLAKKGYANTVYYTHSSMLRSIQEIFGVGPLLGDAAKATNLSDLFRSFP